MEKRFSRRGIFRGAAILAGGGAVVAAGLGRGAASAQDASEPQGVPQSAAQYRTTPNGKAQCDNCLAFVAPSSCKVVAGTISPSGWCAMYTPKS